MAYIGQTFDANSVEPSAANEVIPAGKYQAQIVSSEMRDTKAGDGSYLWMEISIVDGPHANRKLFERLNLHNKNLKAVEIAERTLSAICHATGQMSVTDSDQLHNRTMLVSVKVKPPEGQYGLRNEIGGYESLSKARPAGASVAPVGSSLDADIQHAEAGLNGTKPAATPPWRRQAAG